MAQVDLPAIYARNILEKQLLNTYKDSISSDVTELPAPPPSKELFGEGNDDFNKPICVVGAGPAGLAAAVMLQYIGFTDITVYEASSRIGGRVYTYEFKTNPKDIKCPHNYYDAGAMRLPYIETQKSTFKMIDWLNKDSEKVVLKNYVFDAGKEPKWHEWEEDDTGFDDYMRGLLKSKGFFGTETPGPVKLNSETPASDPESGDKFVTAFWDYINSDEEPDKYSTRNWLMTSPHGPKWDFLKTQKAQTFATSTGLFDQAFMETICDWYDFNVASDQKKPWYRVEGGMSKLTDALYDYAVQNKVKIITKRAVTTMKDNTTTISVACKGTEPKEFAAVFNTTTFGALQRMDLSGLNLSADNICAIRSLSYDRATKVAIKFTQPWWQGLVKAGGVSGTDLCIGNVVYPSWDDGENCAYTIIVSYSWAQDATRMASLMPTNDKESTDLQDPIVQLCFRDLVFLWKQTGCGVTMEKLQSLYCAHHAFSWSHDPNSAGAYALFGPGQFKYLYPQFTKPLCGKKLLICGEAVSAHHAWISGAFDSSYDAILTWCKANGYTKAAGNLIGSPFGGGKGANPTEYDKKLAKWNIILDDPDLRDIAKPQT